MYAGPIAGQVAIHLVAFEAAQGARRFAKSGRIDDNEIVVIGNRLGERETERTAVEIANARFIRVMRLEIANDVYADALVGEKIVADTEYERCTHGLHNLLLAKLTRG